LTITYKASAPGPQSGSLEVYSQSGTLLGTAWLSGSGTAALLNIDPGTVTAIGSGWKAPSAIATDGAGNTYVADSTTGGIYKNGGATAIASGFNAPSAIVVDGAGNLYVGDSGNSRIVEVPYSGASYGTPIVVTTGLLGPSALAINAAGDLYVADSGNARVLLLATGGGLAVGSNPSAVGTSFTSTGTLSTGFTKPVGIASDSNGNVYVADSGKILQVSIKNGVTTTIAQGLSTAAGVAVDPGGNVYYVDSGAKTITRIPNVGGSVTGSGSTILQTAVVAAPTGIALDSSGNLYAVDTTDATVGKLNRSVSSLSFGNVVENSSSSPQTVTLSNGGTSAATLSNPYAVQTGTSDFAIQGSSTCANSGTVAVGGSCSVVEVFKPTTYTSESASISFASNSITAPTLALSGTGVVLVNANITGPTSIVYGAPGSYSVTVTPNVAPSYQVNFTNSSVTKTTTVTIGSNGTGTFTSPATLPAGSYTISLVGTLGSAPVSVTTATLVANVSNATRLYGQTNPTFSCTFTSGIVNNDAVSCLASVANTVTPISPVGNYTISPSAVGAAAVNYTIAPSPTSTYGALSITQATPNVSIADSPASVASNGTILSGTVITFSSVVSSVTPYGTPTGMVTFEDVTLANNIKILGTATLNGSGQASFPVSGLATGTIYVEAIYSGDSNFLSTHSVPQSITISPPTFTVAVTPQTLIIKQGQFGSAQITITPIGNYTAPIVMSCAGLPLETTCAFSPSTVTLANQVAQNVTLVITTTGTSSAYMKRSAPWESMGGGTALALLTGIFVGWRRKRFKTGLFTFLLVAMLGLMPITGCTTGLNEPNFYTPLGTYPSVTITGSSNSTGVVVPATLRLSVTN
jgi:sugar lactone lactonase YvrE